MEESLQQMPGSNMDEQTNTFDQSLNNPVEENYVNQEAQATRRVELQIPVAVFTAHLGYDWSKLPDFVTVDEADGLFEKIMSVKTAYHEGLLPVGDFFKGVLYTGGRYAFAFRLRTVERWDQAKRDGNYCACAFVAVDKFKDIDFEQLLDMEYFREASPNPAATLDYYDEDFCLPTSAECGKVICDLKEGHYSDFDWRLIGSILSDFGYANDEWLFARINTHGESSFVPKFGNWETLREYPMEGDCQNTNNEGEIQAGEMLPDTIVAQTDTHPTHGQTVAFNHEIQQSELQGEYVRYGSGDDELTDVKEQLANKTAECNAVVNSYNELHGRFDKLSRTFQMARQERDDAKRSCSSLQRRIRILEEQANSKNTSIDLLPVLIAFFLGMVVSVVASWGIQLLIGCNGNEEPHVRGAYTEN